GGPTRDPLIPEMRSTPTASCTGTTTSKSIPHRSDRAPAQTERGARPGQIAEPHPDRDGIPLRRSTADRLGGLGSATEQVGLLCHWFCLSRSGIWVCSILSDTDRPRSAPATTT